MNAHQDTVRRYLKRHHNKTLRDVWTWTEDRHWWQVAVTGTDFDAWLYADSAQQAKLAAYRKWSHQILNWQDVQT